MEEWRTIKDFPIYSVSNLGNVKNDITGQVLKNSVKAGYCNVSLTNENNKKSFKVHRLVALAFIDNPENKSDVNHKDKNKLNNNLMNLEWMTRKENNIHRCEGVKIKCNKNKLVLRINPDTNEVIEKYDSIELAGTWAYNNGYTKTIHNGRNAIGNCVNGLSKVAYKFKWEYENKNNDLKNEIWKQVILENVDMEDKRYFVSNLGRFKNSSGIIMENYKANENGYIRVYIYNKTYALHRLIALAFHENPENKEQVNHIDGNKLNNSVQNLEWVTNKENQIHKFQIGLGNNFTKKIVQYDLEMNKIKEFESIAGAAKELNIGKTNINGVLKNRRNTAGGFVFKYIDDNTINFEEKVTINKNIRRNVIQYDLEMNIIKIHDSISDAARNVNIHKNNIWAVVHNIKKRAGGFIWKYLEE
jgi:molybdenum-dependent DNA-binding transcriptional regulator ModE